MANQGWAITAFKHASKGLSMSTIAPKLSLVFAIIAVGRMALLWYAHITHTHDSTEGGSQLALVTGFRDLHPSSSNFGVSFRPARGAVDYALRVYDTETSVMPLDDVWWSDSGCLPYDEQDYCIDAGPHLTKSSSIAGSSGMLPYWFSMIVKYPNREIEGERFCFDGFHLDASLCPESETERLELVERDGEWVIERKVQSAQWN